MTLALVLGGLLALGTSVAAARVVAPPGNSEADQYFQTVPGSAGPRSPDSSRTPDDAVREGTLPAASAAALEARGPSGEALADAVGATGPSGVADISGSSGEGAAAPGGGEGLGVLFPLALLGAAAGAIAFAVARRRRATSA